MAAGPERHETSPQGPGVEDEDGGLAELIASIELSPIATAVTLTTRADNPLVAVNQPFCDLTGYSRDEVIGRNCRILAGPETEPEARAALREAIAAGAPAMVELSNYRKDGSVFRNAVMIAPLRSAEGEVIGFVGSQMDVGPAPPGAEARTEDARGRIDSLTERQRQVLALMADGRLNKEIAARLGISLSTVKLHRSLLLERLGARTSADAIRIAVQAGLASDPAEAVLPDPSDR